MKSLLLLSTLLVVATPTRAAGLDCKKASTAVEKLICTNPDLVELDINLARSYGGLLAVIGADAEAALKADQRAWLANERGRCSDAACLKAAYGKRIKAVEQRVAAAFTAPASGGTSYSFEKAPLVNPALVQELVPLESDSGDQIVAVDVQGSQRSNRFFATPHIDKGPDAAPTISYRKDESVFGYHYVGRTTSGVIVLQTFSSGGGSGTFESLLLVSLRQETGGMSPPELVDSGTVSFTRKRLVLRKLGEIGLGDRWSGDLAVKGNEIHIGANKGVLATQEPSPARIVKVDYQP